MTNGLLETSQKVRSKLTCFSKCAKNIACASAIYHNTLKDCSMYNKPVTALDLLDIPEQNDFIIGFRKSFLNLSYVGVWIIYIYRFF